MKIKNKGLRHRFTRSYEGEGEGEAAGGGVDGAAAAAAAAGAAGAGEGSLIPEGGEAPGTGAPPVEGAAPVPGEHDWLPEKFRVMVDGKLDEAASARKLAQSYTALEAHKGPIPAAPATPDDYTIEPPKGADGKPIEFDMAEFTGDPLFKGFATKAHAAGLTNEQMQFVIGEYLTIAPELMNADKALSLEEARTELQTIWKDDASMQANLAGVRKAIHAFGAEADDVPGSRARLMEKYGRDPDFIAFSATVAKELKEDSAPAATHVASEVDVESLMKSPAYWDKNSPDHARIKAQVDTHFARRYGNTAHR